MTYLFWFFSSCSKTRRPVYLTRTWRPLLLDKGGCSLVKHQVFNFCWPGYIVRWWFEKEDGNGWKRGRGYCYQPRSLLHGEVQKHAIQSNQSARLERVDQADELLKQGSESLNRAHEFPDGTDSAEIIGQDNKFSLCWWVHGQDHLMCALTTHDLAVQIVDFVKQVTTSSGDERK